MKIALVTNQDERCGLSEYGRNLRQQILKKYDVEVFRHCPEGTGFGAVIINWHPAVIGFTPQDVVRMKSHGAKVILILQESYQEKHRVKNTDALAVVDAVVAHEQMDIEVENGSVNFRIIPHGLPVVEKLAGFSGWEPWIGTAGFAFPTKRMDITIKASQALDGKALLVAPQHPTYDATNLYTDWNRMGGDRVHIISDWIPEEEVVNYLSTMAINMYFAHETGAPGQSGSVRMMAAAKRPMIVYRCKKVTTLAEFADEIYFVGTESEAIDTAKMVWSGIRNGTPVKTPERMVAELSWNTTGKLYRNLITELVGE